MTAHRGRRRVGPSAAGRSRCLPSGPADPPVRRGEQGDLVRARARRDGGGRGLPRQPSLTRRAGDLLRELHLATTKAVAALAGKFDAAIWVPVPVGSIADVTAVTARRITSEEVNGAFWDEAASDRYRGVLGVAEDPVDSADIIGDPRASGAGRGDDPGGGPGAGQGWYDNEWGFTCQMIREAFTGLELPAPCLDDVRL